MEEFNKGQHEPAEDEKDKLKQIKVISDGVRWRIITDQEMLPVSLCESILNSINKVERLPVEKLAFWKSLSYALIVVTIVLLLIMATH